ncbi:MAG: hypothetical protein JWP42_2472 [Pseudomonas sp.]|nr:hypothetical protein [Pseudomonas sp.]
MSAQDQASDPLAPLHLPAAIRAQASRLFSAIKDARDLRDLMRASVRAEGFALGIETARALPPLDLENLYQVFEGVAQKRRVDLGG